MSTAKLTQKQQLNHPGIAIFTLYLPRRQAGIHTI